MDFDLCFYCILNWEIFFVGRMQCFSGVYVYVIN